MSLWSIYFVSSAEELIGKTPLLDLSASLKTRYKLYVKLEYLNPSGSIKDRLVYSILKSLSYRPREIVEASSGNTGIALALWGRVHGIRVTVVIPKDASPERKHMLRLLGARIVEIDRNSKDEIEVAKRIARKRKAFYLGQFSREENPKAYISLAKELCKLRLNYFVAGVGTGGTLVGVAKYLKPKGVEIVAVLPKERTHAIQGLRKVPRSDFWKEELVDEYYYVSTREARRYMHKLWNLGFLVGRSSGANLKAALHYSKHGNVATVFPDSWDRYLSVELEDLKILKKNLRHAP